MKKSGIILLALFFIVRGFSQGSDADSIFSSDDSAIAFYENFEVGSLDNLPDWDEVITYKDLTWINLTLSIYRSRMEGGPFPAILFFHGGGWQTRALNQYRQYAWYFAGLGFNTVIVKYRVFDDSPDVTPYDELEDAKSAIRYIRQYSTSLNTDEHMIIATGMSAGGQLAASTAYISGFEAQHENLEISSCPDALILQNAVIDLSEEGWQDGHEYFGDNWITFSPLQNIDTVCRSVPSLLLNGSSDNLAPIGSMKKWDLAYQDLGCDDQLYIFKGRGHGFGNYSESKSGEGHHDFIYSLYFMMEFLSGQGLVPDLTDSWLQGKGVEENTVIYPNPSSDKLTVRAEHPIDRIIVYSSSGSCEQIIYVGNIQKTIDLKPGGRGLKLLRIIYAGGKQETKYFVNQ